MRPKKGRRAGIHTPIRYHTEEERKKAQDASRRKYVAGHP